MELISLQSPTSLISCTSSSSSSCINRRTRLHKPAPAVLHVESLSFPCKIAKCSSVTTHGLFHLNYHGSASAKASTVSISSTSGASEQQSNSKETDLVFVAGSTGRVGSRTVRELLKFGFRVRAGVRSVQRAEALLQSVQQMKVDSATTQPAEKLEVVECDLEDKGGIRSAIGNASTVICCIGASEKEVFDVTGPYRIDYMATNNLIEAASLAKVEHFILLTSLGTNKIGFPAAILNLFWGVLLWKRKAEEALIASGLPYTIVRPGGMERPTDSYKETHNLVLANEDTYFGSQVSNLQVAELMACMVKNKKLSYCKIVEVIAETTAPLLPMEELLARIPSKREPPPEMETGSKPVAESRPIDQIVDGLPKQEKPKGRQLSPYWMYEDLKPPSSPSPSAPSTSSAVKKPAESVEPKAGAKPVSTVEKLSASDGKSRPLSPYTAFPDLKPPSSPSPRAPITLSTSSIGTDGSPSTTIPQKSTPSESESQEHSVSRNHQPLSPYPRYEDMKPPSSPMPFAPKS